MKKMIENLLSKKNSDDADVIRKDMAEDTPVSRMVKKNLDSIKKMAEKGGISINQLIKMLRSE